MVYSIVINVGKQKKPWETVPIEVLIEDERKKTEERKDRRPHLYAPSPMPPPCAEPHLEEDDDYKIVIKL